MMRFTAGHQQDLNELLQVICLSYRTIAVPPEMHHEKKLGRKFPADL